MTMCKRHSSHKANAAREYLDKHNLVEFTQLLVQSASWLNILWTALKLAAFSYPFQIPHPSSPPKRGGHQGAAWTALRVHGSTVTLLLHRAHIRTKVDERTVGFDVVISFDIIMFFLGKSMEQNWIRSYINRIIHIYIIYSAYIYKWNKMNTLL